MYFGIYLDLVLKRFDKHLSYMHNDIQMFGIESNYVVFNGYGVVT